MIRHQASRLHAISTARGTLAFVASLLIPVAAAHEFVATVTLVEGTNALISDSQGYLPAVGVRLRHCDIVQTGPKALAQLETDDGGMIELGRETRFLADLPYRRGEEPVIGPHVLLAGWVKLTVPKRTEGPPHRINTPFFDLVVNAGIAVLQVTADGAQFFVESGEAVALAPSGGSTARVAVRAGRMYSRKAGQATGGLGGASRTRLRPGHAAGILGHLARAAREPEGAHSRAEAWASIHSSGRRGLAEGQCGHSALPCAVIAHKLNVPDFPTHLYQSAGFRSHSCLTYTHPLKRPPWRASPLTMGLTVLVAAGLCRKSA